jgi:hypothetical protein
MVAEGMKNCGGKCILANAPTWLSGCCGGKCGWGGTHSGECAYVAEWLLWRGMWLGGTHSGECAYEGEGCVGGWAGFDGGWRESTNCTGRRIG